MSQVLDRPAFSDSGFSKVATATVWLQLQHGEQVSSTQTKVIRTTLEQLSKLAGGRGAATNVINARVNRMLQSQPIERGENGRILWSRSFGKPFDRIVSDIIREEIEQREKVPQPDGKRGKHTLDQA